MVDSSDASIRKEFIVQQNQLPWELRHKQKIVIDDVVQYFDLKSGRLKNIFSFPYLDEREFKLYLRKLATRKQLPDKGYFWLINTEIYERPFGLITTVTYIAAIRVKESDNRFELVKRLVTEMKHFYYYYEPTKEIVKTKVGDEEIEEEVTYQNIYKQVLLDAKDNPHTKEYQRREEMLEEALEMLSPVGEIYKLRLEIIYDKLLKVNPILIVSMSQFDYFFERYKRLVKKIEPLIPLKLLYSHTDREEYEFLLTYIEHLKERIEKLKEEFTNFMNEYNAEDVHFTEDKQFLVENTPLQKQTSALLATAQTLVKDCIRLFEPRPEYKKDKDGFSVTDEGYLKMIDGRLFPSLLTIELRRTFTNLPQNEEKTREIEEAVLEYLNKKAQDAQLKNENYKKQTRKPATKSKDKDKFHEKVPVPPKNEKVTSVEQSQKEPIEKILSKDQFNYLFTELEQGNKDFIPVILGSFIYNFKRDNRNSDFNYKTDEQYLADLIQLFEESAKK